MPHVLSTKKLSIKHIEHLKSFGINVTDIDFISIEHLNIKALPSADIYFFSSQNAVKSIIHLPNIQSIKPEKCVCVGKKTYQLLKQHQFNVVKSYSSAEDLASNLHLFDCKNSAVYFCGNIRLDTIPMAVSNYFSSYNEVIVYRTCLIEHRVAFQPDAVLFFSPSQVKGFLLKNQLNAPAFCIGKTTAHPLQLMGKNAIFPNEATIEATLSLCIEHLSKY